MPDAGTVTISGTDFSTFADASTNYVWRVTYPTISDYFSIDNATWSPHSGTTAPANEPLTEYFDQYRYPQAEPVSELGNWDDEEFFE